MKKLLVADDSVTIQKVIALTFADEPVEIQSVGSGSDALEKIKEWRPDIILADVIMPQVNGYELSKAVKDHEETKGIPVLLLAGTFEAFDEEEARAAGADDFITKPFESGELIEKVNGLLSVSAQAPQATIEQVPAIIPEATTIQAQDATEEIVTVSSGEPMEPVLETPRPMTVEEPVTAEEPVITEEPQITEEPVITEEAMIAEEPMLIEKILEPQDPVPQAPVDAVGTEPDIWDILSEADTGDLAEAREPADFSTERPSLGVLEGAGVVDVGSFEVGLDRTEGLQVEDLVTMEPGQSLDPAEPAGPEDYQPGDSPSMAEERSKVEERERDFFGFETAGTDKEDVGLVTEAIEEITFDLEEQTASDQIPGIPGEDVSFVIPEPDTTAGKQTGDTASPEIFAPDTADEMDNGIIAEVPDASVITEPPVVSEPPVVPEPMEVQPDVLPPDTLPLETLSPEPEMSDEIEEVEFTLAEEIPSPLDTEPQVNEEPYVSLDLEPQVPEERPAPFAVQTPSEVDTPGSVESELGLDASPVDPPQEPLSVEMPDEEIADIPQIKDADLDAMVRAIVEEKVEKIAWEVIPELSEVLIKEAIEKIKSGS
jgi:CheY-like chemotaxis protein